MNATLNTAIQDVLTRGLDVARAVVLDRLHVNDPAGVVTGPAGTKAQVGQPAAGSVGAAVAAVPSWVWIGGAVLLGLVVVVPLLRR